MVGLLNVTFETVSIDELTAWKRDGKPYSVTYASMRDPARGSTVAWAIYTLSGADYVLVERSANDATGLTFSLDDRDRLETHHRMFGGGPLEIRKFPSSNLWITSSRE